MFIFTTATAGFQILSGSVTAEALRECWRGWMFERLQFTVRRHKFNEYSLCVEQFLGVQLHDSNRGLRAQHRGHAPGASTLCLDD